MDVRFYDSWLLVGDQEHIVRDTFPIVELVPSAPAEPRAVAAPAAGFCCRFANKLRNSNCYLNLDVPSGSEFSVKRVNDVKVLAIGVNAQRLVVESKGLFYLYDNASLRLVKQQQWWGRGSGVTLSGSKIYAMDVDLREYGLDGTQLSEVIVTGASDLFFYEVTAVDSTIFMTGFESFPRMEGVRGECCFVRAFKLEEISPPRGSLQLSEIANEQTVAFFDDLRIIPVFLDDLIIQPSRQGVAVFNHDLKVQRVIIGDFVPYYASAGLDSKIYMIAAFGDTDRLLAFTAEGISLFNVEIQRLVGQPTCPPLVATDGKVYVVGNEGVAACDTAGKSLWHHPLNPPRGAGIYAVLFNDHLVIGYGNRMVALRPDGEMLFAVEGLEGEISTPMVGLGNRTFAVGTTTGLYKLTVGRQ